MSEFKKGEVLIFLDDYDLFDKNMLDQEVMFYKYTSAGKKCLVLDPKSSEWGEPAVEILKQKKPGYVPRKFATLCKRIKLMEVSC